MPRMLGEGASKQLLAGLGLAAWLACMQLVSSQNTVEFTIKLDEPTLKQAVGVPPAFMGLSIEPHLHPMAMGWYANDTVFRALLARLTDYQTGPLIIRWGGHSQDETNSPYKPQVWDALVDLHTALDKKVQFTLPVNLKSQDPEMQGTQLLAALQRFAGHEDAIYGFSIGNEPDEYGKHDPPNGPHFKRNYMDKRYWKELQPFAERLWQKIATGWGGGNVNWFTGPAISAPRLFPPDKVSELAGVSNDKQDSYFKAATVHLTGIRSHDAEAAKSIALKDTNLDPLRDAAALYAAKAQEYKLAFRVEQISMVEKAGLPGASDTLAGALYVIKASLNLLQAGVSGVNFHCTGCSPNGPILFPRTCQDLFYSPSSDNVFQATCGSQCDKEDAPAMVNAPFYGMWFMQKLLRHHQQLQVLPDAAVAPDPDNNDNDIKLYALQSNASLRIVIVNANRDASMEDTVQLYLPGDQWGHATVTVLSGSQGLASTASNITLAGQHVGPDGQLQGKHTTCKVEREVNPDVEDVITGYELKVKAGSAAVMVIPNIHKLKGPDTDTWLEEGLPDNVKC